jgi:tetratricopeptide (TPR) repeat protein
VHDLPTIQVPATVQAVLAARIDRLPPEEKRLVQTAAVIGTEVSLPLLQAIAELPEEALHRGLTHLQAAEFLYETQLYPDCAYTFKHALTHEVAYSSLLQERRRALHAQIMEALEALAGDRLEEQVDRLAYHAFRGEVWDKAHTYFQQAGTKAMARSAHSEAVVCFEQALTALQHLPGQRDTREQAIDLRLDLRNARMPLGELNRVLHDLHAAETLAKALGDQHRLGRVSLYMTLHSYYTGEHDRAIVSGQRALALATASEDAGTQAMANVYLGANYHAQGTYQRAIDCCRQAVASLEGDLLHQRFGQAALPAVLSRAWLPVCLAEVGAFTEGIVVGEEGLQIAEAVKHPVSLMLAHWGVSVPYLHRGALHRALPLLERAVRICQEADLPLYFPRIAVALGAAYALSRRVADTVLLLKQAVEQAASMGIMGYQALRVATLSEAHLLAGRLEEAITYAERALDLSRTYKERGHEAYALRLLGDIAAHHDPPDVDSAGAHYRQALALAEELGMRPLQAHCHRGLGTLYGQTGRMEQARAELSTAIELYRDMEMTFWLPQTEAALAQVEKCMKIREEGKVLTTEAYFELLRKNLKLD